MALVQTEPKKIYLWTNEVKWVFYWENKVRPPYKPRTFTISRTEQSNMSSWWTYSDDAAWLTAGDGAFDDFFWYSAVLLNTSGVETAEMKQSWWVFSWAMTTLGNITSGDNVMIKFPVRWIKMTKSWSTVTLSITEELNKSWYQYYAHSTWTLASPWTPKDAFYLGAYKWFTSSSKLKSWSWKAPDTNVTQANSCTYAKSNGSWYNIWWFYQRMYITALYMMKYGNPNSQSVVWQWYTNWSSYQSTWATNSITNATWATTTSSTWRIKLFWLEDRWGNTPEWVWWAYTNSSKVLYCMLTGRAWTLSWWESTWTTITQTSSYTCLSSVAGNNKSMFAPIWTVNNSSWNTYYSSYNGVNGSCLWSAWGSLYDATGSGIFEWIITNIDITGNVSGSRLMYLNWLT